MCKGFPIYFDKNYTKNRRSACVGFLWSITEPIKGVLYSFLYQVLTCRSPESCRHFTDT